MNPLSKYIQYKLKAQTKHGIHSPFVFDFITNCTTIKLPKEFQAHYRVLRQKTKQRRDKISVSDFGAGSKRLGRERSIRKIYQTATTKGVYANLLYQITQHYKPKHILELGTSLGFGSIMLASGNQESQLHTVEACYATLELAKENFASFNLKNIHTYHSTFQEFFQRENLPTFDLVYIDGHHEGTALKQYLQSLQAYTHDDTIFIIDDIIWSADMNQTFNELIASDRYHVTMDLFRWGLIIQRPQQEKEHFTIRLKNILGGLI